MVTKLKVDNFSGAGRVFTRTPLGLAPILRGMLIDTARLKVEVSGVADFVNNSGGAANANGVTSFVPTTPVDSTLGAGGETLTHFNTAMTDIANAGLVMTNTINEASALLGLPANTAASGAQVTANTIAALILAGVEGSGAAAVSFASAVAAIEVANANLAAVANGVNEVLVALGVTPVAVNLGPTNIGLAAIAIPAGAASAAVASVPSALSVADATTFYLAYAASVTNLAVAWNAAMNQGSPGAGPLHVIAG